MMVSDEPCHNRNRWRLTTVGSRGITWRFLVKSRILLGAGHSHSGSAQWSTLSSCSCRTATGSRFRSDRSDRVSRGDVVDVLAVWAQPPAATYRILERGRVIPGSLRAFVFDN